MFALKTATPTPGKMDVRKELRLHRKDAKRIKEAAAATGLKEADFIREAALLRAAEVERSAYYSVLPPDTFKAFKKAVEAPGKFVPGLARADEASKGILKEADLGR